MSTRFTGQNSGTSSRRHALALRWLVVTALGWTMGVAARPHDACAGEKGVLLALPPGVSARTVLRTAENALHRRQWTVTDVSNDFVVGHINHKGVDAIVTLTIRGEQLTYFCEATRTWTEDGGVGGDPRGEPVETVVDEDYIPTRWLGYLRMDILTMLREEGARPPSGDGSSDSGEESGSVIERLKTLERLRSRGLITTEEYHAKRAEILAEL